MEQRIEKIPDSVLEELWKIGLSEIQMYKAWDIIKKALIKKKDIIPVSEMISKESKKLRSEENAERRKKVLEKLNQENEGTNDLVREMEKALSTKQKISKKRKAQW